MYRKNIQVGNLNCACRAKMLDYHVVTDTISLGSIPGEGVGRSGAAPVPPLSHMVVGYPIH